MRPMSAVEAGCVAAEKQTLGGSAVAPPLAAIAGGRIMAPSIILPEQAAFEICFQPYVDISCVRNDDQMAAFGIGP